MPVVLRQPHIFISFKTEERASALALKEALEQGGLSVWWQENIQCGREWHGEIDAALLSAGCVVVLWTAASIKSPWVRHEASQAVARGVYTPVRLSPMAIGSPFDRIQATDLFNWKGDANHPGLLGLLARAAQLIPKPRSPLQRSMRFLRRNIGVLASSLVAAAAIGILVFMSFGLERQLDAQAAIAQSIQRALHPLSDIEVQVNYELDQEADGFRDYLAFVKKDAEVIADGPCKEPNDLNDVQMFCRALGLSIFFSRVDGRHTNYDLSFEVGRAGSGSRFFSWRGDHPDKVTIDLVQTVRKDSWMSTNEILSTIDLEHSAVTIRPVFGRGTFKRLNGVRFRVSGQAYTFQASDLHYEEQTDSYRGQFAKATKTTGFVQPSLVPWRWWP